MIQFTWGAQTDRFHTINFILGAQTDSFVTIKITLSAQTDSFHKGAQMGSIQWEQVWYQLTEAIYNVN